MSELDWPVCVEGVLGEGAFLIRYSGLGTYSPNVIVGKHRVLRGKHIHCDRIGQRCVLGVGLSPARPTIIPRPTPMAAFISVPANLPSSFPNNYG